MGRMKVLIRELGLKDSVVLTPHGICGNLASALDLAKLAAECFKIPLFSKISSTQKIVIKTKEVNEDGEVATRSLLLTSSNQLLGHGCLGGKTGSSIAGG
jgi:D-alanyl-D-alanine carboxypeptidase